MLILFSHFRNKHLGDDPSGLTAAAIGSAPPNAAPTQASTWRTS